MALALTGDEVVDEDELFEKVRCVLPDLTSSVIIGRVVGVVVGVEIVVV